MPSMVEQFQRLANEYIAENGRASAMDIAAHAVRNRLWIPEPSDMIRQCARLFTRAMRQEYFIDPQGRRVRAKHASTLSGEQTAFWDDIRTASQEHILVGFQQRREQILGECKHLKMAVDSYNDNLNNGELLQMIFDFSDDLLELEAGEDQAA